MDSNCNNPPIEIDENVVEFLVLLIEADLECMKKIEGEKSCY